MNVLHDSTRHVGVTLTLLLLVAGFSLWAAVSPVSGVSSGGSASMTTQCLNAADVLAAQDRSRNGVSLTCSQATLSKQVVR